MVVVTDEAELAEVHTGILAPAFPPEELDDLEAIRSGVAAGTTEVVVLRDAGRTVAVAVADVFVQGRVVLLSYLAVDPSHRSAGHGGRLLDAALDRWTAAHDPCLVLAEVEDPAHYREPTTHGDPAARVRFYARRGAAVLGLPYFQPALRRGAVRVSHLLLVVLHVAPALRVEEGRVDAATVLEFLRELFLACEGRLPDDVEGRRLLHAAEASPGVPMMLLPHGPGA
jgi:GNAT superfamily N-acetyltransferase